MAARRLTRRSLLAGAACTAGALSRPTRTLAALVAVPARAAVPDPPRLAQQWIGALGPGVATIELARYADLVGLEWHTPPDARIELRFRTASGRWGEWLRAGHQGHGPDGRPAPGRLIGEPVWTGGTRALQLSTARALSAARLHLIDAGTARAEAGMSSAAMRDGASAEALALAQPVLAAGPGQPPIIARAAWAHGMAHPRVAPGYGTVQLAFVHHSDNPNGYARAEVPAMLRAIFAFHRYVNGWNDIGYNFAIDSFGRIFEARAGGIDEPVIGAHAGGYNYVSTGIAMLGTFSSRPISPAAHAALEHLLGWKLALHGLPAQGRVTVRVDPAGAVYSRFPADARVPLRRICGHRDADSTECPGDALSAQLPITRARVRRLAPSPARLTMSLVAGSETPPASEPPPVSGAPAPQGSQPAPASEPAPVSGAPAPQGSQPAPASEPTPAAAPAQPGAPAASAAALGGMLELLDGPPIAAATVALQARTVSRLGEVVRERTIAESLTDAQGRWSVPLDGALLTGAVSAAHDGVLSLRALYAGASGISGPSATSGPSGTSGPSAAPAPARATVSEPLELALSRLSALAG